MVSGLPGDSTRAMKLCKICRDIDEPLNKVVGNHLTRGRETMGDNKVTR